LLPIRPVLLLSTPQQACPHAASALAQAANVTPAARPFISNAMSPAEQQRITDYLMPSLPARPSDLGFLFGTRHGVPEFCEAAHALWCGGMFQRLLISGGCTRSSPLAEADVIAGRLVALGVPASVLILETAATNTGENVQFGRARVAEVMDPAAICSVLVIGKICSTRRYLMTLQRHWPGLAMSVCPVNYFGVPLDRWHEHAEFRRRVLDEFDKIPRYLAAGFLQELDNCNPVLA
jgi:uncharacterized SAM-binding protein YcdF (DUF218 family)